VRRFTSNNRLRSLRFRSGALACVLSTFAGAARGDDEVRAVGALDWQRASGAESCLAGPALEQAVEERLARDVFVPRERADIRVEGRIGPVAGGGWKASLALSTARGEPVGTRELVTRAEHCSALDDSLALVVALMVDLPLEQVKERDRAAEQRRGAEQQRSPARVQATPIVLPPRTHAPRKGWQFAAGAAAVVSAGLLPGLAPGIELSAGIEPPSFWYTELSGAAWFEKTAGSAEAGSRFSFAALRLTSCPLQVGATSTRLYGCFGQLVGRLHAEGFGFDRNRERSRLVYDFELGLNLRQRLAGPVWLRTGLRGDVPLVRDLFHSTGADGAQIEH
jgi:hypothetical protein